ncbi:hypothetical protein PR202_ga02614 [Eleusine coracana subsp. coracana]|uniref:RING-type domain-containing protein n=1 Tax=Eleusine coracana subsp. coracana TaxID=191504 RepID=A0AAV5BL84_ELECO|nr:hypothetical protein PR202_ga02614 [Eleusine coracana subsp. coracana]
MAGAHSIVFLAVGLALMFVVHIVVIVWVLALYRVRSSARVRGQLEEGRAGGAAGLSAEEVAELPCHEVKEAAGGDCAVCLDAFRAGDRCRMLPGCEHGFHAQCVDSWLRKSRLCPICRAVVTARGKKEVSGAVSAARTPPTVPGKARKAVAELPCCEIKEGDGGGECAVCLEAFRAGECECVDSWLRNNRRCPLCRAEVISQVARQERRRGGAGRHHGDRCRKIGWDAGFQELCTDRYV